MATFTDERVQKILKGQRDIGRAPFPGSTDVVMGVRVLSDEEIDDARLDAQALLTKRCRSRNLDVETYVKVDPEPLERAVEHEIIWRAFVDTDNPDIAFFPSPDEVKSLPSVTVRALLDIYLDHQETVCPRITLGEADVERLVDALGKEHEPQVILAQFAPETLRLCVRSLASRARELSRTGKSSTGASSSQT